jgi:hypothetical protein
MTPQLQLIEDFKKLWSPALADQRAIKQAEFESLHQMNRIGASMIGGCLRAAFYDYQKTPKSNPPSEAKQARFDLSHVAEKWFMDMFDSHLRKNGLGHIEPQAQLHDDTFLATTDGLVHWHTGEKFPLEFKCRHPNAFYRRETELAQQGINEWRPWESNALQVCQFLWLAEQQNRTDILPYGILWDVSLDGRRRVSTIVLETYRHELHRRQTIVKQHLSEETMPDRLRDALVFPCKGCHWEEWCQHAKIGLPYTLKILYKNGVPYRRNTDATWTINDKRLTAPQVIEYARTLQNGTAEATDDDTEK